MKTQIIAAATASAIALSSIAPAPAQATPQEDLLAAIAIVAAIAMLASASGGAPAPAPTPAAVTYSTGPMVIPQTYRFDLDHGNVGGGANADLWFQAVTPVNLYIKPRNGAQMAVGDRSNRGFAGCSVASYSTHRVSVWSLPVGSYVCVKTNQGRVSQFRVNQLTAGSPKKLKLGYTTWQ